MTKANQGTGLMTEYEVGTYEAREVSDNGTGDERIF